MTSQNVTTDQIANLELYFSVLLMNLLTVVEYFKAETITVKLKPIAFFLMKP